MGRPIASQNNKKNNGFIDKWKRRNIRSKENEIKEINECSNSCFIVKKLLGRFMDFIAWIIIAIIVIYWIKSGLTQVSCPCCTVEMCNSLHGQAQVIGGEAIKGIIPNFTLGG